MHQGHGEAGSAVAQPSTGGSSDCAATVENNPEQYSCVEARQEGRKIKRHGGFGSDGKA